MGKEQVDLYSLWWRYSLHPQNESSKLKYNWLFSTGGSTTILNGIYKDYLRLTLGVL